MRYGGDEHFPLRIGDKLTWNGPLRPQEDRLPGNSGEIECRVACQNDWYSKWLTSIGLGEPGNRNEGIIPGDEPSLAIKKSIGCPKAMRILVRLKEDVITEVRFSDDPEAICPIW